jgi:hypothetical protein
VPMEIRKARPDGLGFFYPFHVVLFCNKRIQA